MSAFKRTTRGLSNQHLFFNVDIVVFLEGGDISYSKEDVYNGEFTSETKDIIFWKNVFDRFVKDKKIKFKSVGSKSVVKEIALVVANDEIKTVYVAMDNEFDMIFNEQIIHSNIFYTHGYSWENDIWNQEVIKSVITGITAIETSQNEIETNFNDFLENIELAVYADAYLFKKGMSFFPRTNKHLFFINITNVDLPLVKQDKIDSELIAKNLKKDTLNRFGRRHAIDALKFCYGHLLADYCYHLIKCYIKKRHLLSNISKEIIHRIGLDKFFQQHFSDGDIYSYYEQQFKQRGLYCNFA
jgi:hypothetical protein